MPNWSKHLDEFSQCPKLSKDKLTFMNMRFCPYAQRVRLVLDAKEIPYQTINLNLSSKPQWFLDKNPLGKVPTVLDGEEIFYESLPVADYLDDAYPGRSLNPKGPKEKLHDRMVLAHFDAGISAYYGFVRSKKLPENAQELQEKFKNVFVFLETELQKRGTLFFNGQTLPGMLDYMIWPWMERLEVPSAIHADLNNILGVPTSDFALMHAWLKAMKNDEVVKGYILDTDTHAKYYREYANGLKNVRNYDDY